jgi:AraC-like DNA-binding protein
MVRAELDKLDIAHGKVELGEVQLNKTLSEQERKTVKIALKKHGFEVMDGQKDILIEKIKNLVIDMVHNKDELPKVNYSIYISGKLDYDYTYLANIFSDVTGSTIEQYIIAHKIEKVKELLLYNELTLTQISYRLDYSSVAYLSRQFKKVTGLTPTFFKNMKKRKRILIEDL